MSNLLVYPKESHALTGAAFDVYYEKGGGFYESVYQECMEIELGIRGIPLERQKEIKLTYKGRTLVKTFQPDVVPYDKIIIELKAEAAITAKHESQAINYLKATNMRLCLIFNFGAEGGLQMKRIVL